MSDSSDSSEVLGTCELLLGVPAGVPVHVQGAYGLEFHGDDGWCVDRVAVTVDGLPVSLHLVRTPTAGEPETRVTIPWHALLTVERWRPQRPA